MTNDLHTLRSLGIGVNETNSYFNYKVYGDNYSVTNAAIAGGLGGLGGYYLGNKINSYTQNYMLLNSLNTTGSQIIKNSDFIGNLSGATVSGVVTPALQNKVDSKE